MGNWTHQQDTDIQDNSVSNGMGQKGKPARMQHTHTHCQSVLPINQICRMSHTARVQHSEYGRAKKG